MKTILIAILKTCLEGAPIAEAAGICIEQPQGVFSLFFRRTAKQFHNPGNFLFLVPWYPVHAAPDDMTAAHDLLRDFRCRTALRQDILLGLL